MEGNPRATYTDIYWFHIELRLMARVAFHRQSVNLRPLNDFFLGVIPVIDEATKTDATESLDKTSPPVWFWVISVVALLWYLMDMSAFFMRVFMTDDAIKAMPENQQHLYRNIPLWVNIVFACEVFGGTLGSVGLLLRNKWALPVFVVSILGVLSQTFHIFFLTDAASTMGAPAVVMPLLAILIGIGMIVLAKTAISKGWLR
jgi:hypothetical protein